MPINRIISSLLVLVVTTLFSQCKKTEPAPPLDATVNVLKSWKVAEVKEGATVVYKAGATGSIYPGYDKFKVVFETDKLTYTEFTGEVFTGRWTVDMATRKLTFHGLNPVPYNTNGLIEFDLLGWSTDQLVLRRTTTSPKTGNTINEYTLVPQ